MTSEFTVFEGIGVAAEDDLRWQGSGVGPAVRVTLPGRDWTTPLTVGRKYATMDEAKDAARGLASRLKALKPRKGAGYYRSPRLDGARPEHVASRDAAEKLVREWAGPDALIVDLVD